MLSENVAHRADTIDDTPYFTEEDSVESFVNRLNCNDERLAEVLESLVKHLHAFIKDVEPTVEEWMTGIKFLTETGQMCNEWRQEYILLSDVLAVSMLVDAINHRKPTGATESTVLGPFYLEDTPDYENGANICLDGKGEPLVVSGRVSDQNGQIIEGAMIEVWQANAEGFYDVQQPDLQPACNLRGRFRSDSDGRYWFRSIKPRHYPIPDDGPAGRLLGLMGRHPYRPAHIHAIISADGYDSVTTHLYFPDCPYINSDTVFGVKESRIIAFDLIEDERQAEKMGVEAPFWFMQADFVIVRK